MICVVREGCDPTVHLNDSVRGFAVSMMYVKSRIPIGWKKWRFLKPNLYSQGDPEAYKRKGRFFLTGPQKKIDSLKHPINKPMHNGLVREKNTTLHVDEGIAISIAGMYFFFEENLGYFSYLCSKLSFLVLNKTNWFRHFPHSPTVLVVIHPREFHFTLYKVGYNRYSLHWHVNLVIWNLCLPIVECWLVYLNVSQIKFDTVCMLCIIW